MFGQLVKVEMTVNELFRLDGKVAIVTGASSGVGIAFAQGLAEAGADVALGARRADRLSDTARLVAEAGGQALVVPTDVGEPMSCTALVEATMERFGRVDVLVNNAGIATAAPATHESPEQFRRVINVNLNGSYPLHDLSGQVAVLPAWSQRAESFVCDARPPGARGRDSVLHNRHDDVRGLLLSSIHDAEQERGSEHDASVATAK
jgi:NAD(P)-dependent dehydrogenase (short-subunit alcohol dehydrogenase family)